MKLHNIPKMNNSEGKVDNNTKYLMRITLLMTLLWTIMVLEIGKNYQFFGSNTWALYVSIFYGLILPLGIFFFDTENNVIIHNLMPLISIIFLLIFWRENLMVVVLLNSIISYLLILMIFIAMIWLLQKKKEYKSWVNLVFIILISTLAWYVFYSIQLWKIGMDGLFTTNIIMFLYIISWRYSQRYLHVHSPVINKTPMVG